MTLAQTFGLLLIFYLLWRSFLMYTKRHHSAHVTRHHGHFWTCSCLVWFSSSSPLYFLFSKEGKKGPSVWTSKNKWLYSGKPRNLWAYLSREPGPTSVPLRLLQWFLHHPSPIPTITPGASGAIFRLPRFPCRDATLSGRAERPFLVRCRCYLHK